MSTLEYIQSEIKALPLNEFRALSAWLDEHKSNVWDAQIEADARNGKLDRLLEEAQSVIVYQEGASGVAMPVVNGTGVRVQTLVVAHDVWGMTPEMVADEYEMTLDQVEAALSFYAENKVEIDTQMADEDAMTPPLHV